MNDPEYRYLAVREVVAQPAFPGMEKEQPALPFPTLDMEGKKYKIQGLVTNDWEIEAKEWVEWHYDRCGKSEEAQGVLKDDFGGGQFPSADFGENAAWWWFSVLAMNLNQAMKSLVLRQIDESWVSKRAKAIRFSLINIPGRVVKH